MRIHLYLLEDGADAAVGLGGDVTHLVHAVRLLRVPQHGINDLDFGSQISQWPQKGEMT